MDAFYFLHQCELSRSVSVSLLTQVKRTCVYCVHTVHKMHRYDTKQVYKTHLYKNKQWAKPISILV